jgi:hypothetical protein
MVLLSSLSAAILSLAAIMTALRMNVGFVHFVLPSNEQNRNLHRRKYMIKEENRGIR